MYMRLPQLKSEFLQTKDNTRILVFYGDKKRLVFCLCLGFRFGKNTAHTF